MTTDDITTTTITIATAGTSVALALWAASAASISGRKVRPSGKSWIARVTSHNAGATTATIDAAPDTVAETTRGTPGPCPTRR